MSGAEEVLVAEDLHKWFGKLHAVDGVSFRLRRGEVLSIVGPNGAGKTTLLNLISGVVKPDAGRVFLRRSGELVDITGRPPHEVTRLGLGRSFQIPNIFDGLTVEENILISLLTRTGRTGVVRRGYRDFPELEEELSEIIETFGLGEVRGRLGSELSHGMRKKLDIAVSFALRPMVLLLDEPTSGLTQGEKRDMVGLIKGLRGGEYSFIIVEHDLDVVREVSDSLIVMHEGRVLAHDEPEKVLQMSEVISAYLGGYHEAIR